MKVFLTGATGFIGRRLLDRLLAEGCEVTALARSPGLPGARVCVGDLLDPAAWRGAGQGCERVYHLAALISFDPRRRGELLRVNGEGTRLVLEAAAAWGARRVVVVSSACTLGLSRSPGRVLDESSSASAADAAANPYLASKLEAESHARRFAEACGAVVVNPTTVYGPGDRGMNSGTLVKLAARAPVLPVPPGGGSVVDVDDVVSGILAAAQMGKPGERYALGSENLSFQAIFDAVCAAVGRNPPRVRLPRWTRMPAMAAAAAGGCLLRGRFLTPQIVGDMYRFKYCCGDRARRDLGWRPRFSFSESVGRAVDFYRREGLI